MLFETAPTIGTKERAKPRKRSARPRSRSRVSYQTWTCAELAIADYLLGWALERIRDGYRVQAFVEMRQRVHREIQRKHAAAVERFVLCIPPAPHERGAHTETLNAILRKIIERQGF